MAQVNERINIFSGIVYLNKTYGNFFAAERGGARHKQIL
jgi:hypothetical protein